MLINICCLLSFTVCSGLSSGGGGGLPSSERSRAVIGTITPRLQKEMSEKGLVLGSPIFIRIFKESSELELWVQKDARYYLFRSYRVCCYSGDLGPKTRQGDLQSPEGFYYVTPGRMNPSSQFHLSFNLGYPNKYDRYHKRTGSALMVHGDCVSIGCYAMTDEQIEEIYTVADAALKNGQPFFRVHVFPFEMTNEKMKEYADSRWYPFWANLKEGHDIFEESKVPPDVEVQDGKYIFNRLLYPRRSG